MSEKSTNKLLSWSHYQILRQVHDDTSREWYANEALNESWNVRTLQRNASSQYYYRLLKAQKKRTREYQNDKLSFISNTIKL